MGTTVALILFDLSIKISIILAQTPCVPSHDMSNGHYTCAANGTKICDPGFLGADCKNTDACSTSPCQNGGTCETLVAHIPPWTCHCPPNVTGRRCETPIQTTSPANTILTSTGDGCAPSPCKNGGTCTNQAGGGFKCACPPPFSGFQCQNSPPFRTQAPTSSPSTSILTTILPPTTNGQRGSASPTSMNLITTATPNPITTPKATSKVMSSSMDDTWLIVGGSIGSFLLFALLVSLIVFLCSRDKNIKNNKVEQATHPRPTWTNRDKVLHYI